MIGSRVDSRDRKRQRDCERGTLRAAVINNFWRSHDRFLSSFFFFSFLFSFSLARLAVRIRARSAKNINYIMSVLLIRRSH